jgi:hypothetical protein
MKKVLLTAFAVMASLSLFAQGTVTYANSAATKVMYTDPITQVTGPAGNICSVGLWFGAPGTAEGSLTFLAGTTKTINSGIFLGGTQTLPGIAGGTQAAVQVRGWVTSAGSYDAAVAGGFARGASTLFTMPTGNPPLVPAVGIVNGGFTSFTIAVPEPSTIALGLLGLAGLFVLRRRS